MEKTSVSTGVTRQIGGEDELPEGDHQGDIPEGKKEDVESAEDQEKPGYPYQIFVIILNEAFSMFSWYGMKSILQLYLMQVLGIAGHFADAIQHGFAGFYYMMTPVAGNIADSYIGRYWTIVIASVFYVIGHLTLSSSDLPGIGRSTAIGLTVLALVIIAFGQGGMKATVASFGAQQFVLPWHERELNKYFSVFYLMVNAGATFGQFLIPVLRTQVSCFGAKTCYPLAFGIPAIFAVLTAISFVIGTPWYKYTPPTGNAFFKCLRCMFWGFYNKRTRTADQEHEHWLDYAQYSGFEKDFILDTKMLLSVLLLSLPVPFFWALYDQNATKWIRQSLDMERYLGGGIVIEPDNMLVINPVLIIALLPIFAWVIYPYLDKVRVLHTPLKKMSVGLVFMTMAFIVATVLQYIISKGHPHEPSPTESSLRLISLLTEPTTIFLVGPTVISSPLGTTGTTASFDGLEAGAPYAIKANSQDGPDLATYTGNSGEVMTGLVSGAGDALTYLQSPAPDKTGEPDGTISIRILHDLGAESQQVALKKGDSEIHNFGTLTGRGFSPYKDSLQPGFYALAVDGKVMNEQQFASGGQYSVVLGPGIATAAPAPLQIAATRPGNKIHILWQAVMYALVGIGEILFSPIGLELFYTEAPESMKSFLTGWWYALSGIGQIVVVVISAANPFSELWQEFMFYTVLILIVTLLFMVIAHYYTYRANRLDQEKSAGDLSTLSRFSAVVPEDKN